MDNRNGHAGVPSFKVESHPRFKDPDEDRNTKLARKMEKECAGCIYLTSNPFYKGQKICDYMQMTGHSRIKICPPGALCTVKQMRGRKRAGRRRKNGWKEDQHLIGMGEKA